MPTYEIPDIVAVELARLELPQDVPVDADFTEKPLADCSKREVEMALRAFTGLVRQSQNDLEASIATAYRDPSPGCPPPGLPREFRRHLLGTRDALTRQRKWDVR